MKDLLNQRFTIKDLGFAKYFIGLEISRSEDGIFNQHKYMLDLLQDVGLMGCKPVVTPLPKNHKLNNEDGKLLSDPSTIKTGWACRSARFLMVLESNIQARPTHLACRPIFF